MDFDAIDKLNEDELWELFDKFAACHCKNDAYGRVVWDQFGNPGQICCATTYQTVVGGWSGYGCTWQLWAAENRGTCR